MAHLRKEMYVHNVIFTTKKRKYTVGMLMMKITVTFMFNGYFSLDTFYDLIRSCQCIRLENNKITFNEMSEKRPV